MPACLIVCNRSYSFSLQLLFKQDIAWLHQRKLILTIAVFGCFTMKWVLWPNAPIIGGWAVLFTPENTYFLKSSSVKKIVKSCTQSQMKTFSYSSFKSRILHTSEAFAIWGWWVGAGLQTPQQKRSRSNSPLILIPQLLLLLSISIFWFFLARVCLIFTLLAFSVSDLFSLLGPELL